MNHPRSAAMTTAVWMMLCGCLYPGALAAHGVEVYDVTDTLGGAGAVRTIHFAYSTGEPMAYAVVRLYPPSAIEVLRSVTDRNGRFSFVPDEAGPWRVTAEDGMGHQGAVAVQVDEEAAAGVADGGGAAAGGGAPLVMRVILGVSLIGNIFAGYALVLPRLTRRLKPKEAPPAHQ